MGNPNNPWSADSLKYVPNKKILVGDVINLPFLHLEKKRRTKTIKSFTLLMETDSNTGSNMPSHTVCVLLKLLLL